MNNYVQEAKALLTSDRSRAMAICHLCGRLYTARPFLCLCNSNAFLQEVKKQVTTQETKNVQDN